MFYSINHYNNPDSEKHQIPPWAVGHTAYLLKLQLLGTLLEQNTHQLKQKVWK